MASILAKHYLDIALGDQASKLRYHNDQDEMPRIGNLDGDSLEILRSIEAADLDIFGLQCHKHQSPLVAFVMGP